MLDGKLVQALGGLPTGECAVARGRTAHAVAVSAAYGEGDALRNAILHEATVRRVRRDRPARHVIKSTRGEGFSRNAFAKVSACA